MYGGVSSKFTYIVRQRLWPSVSASSSSSITAACTSRRILCRRGVPMTAVSDTAYVAGKDVGPVGVDDDANEAGGAPAAIGPEEAHQRGRGMGHGEPRRGRALHVRSKLVVVRGGWPSPPTNTHSSSIQSSSSSSAPMNVRGQSDRH